MTARRLPFAAVLMLGLLAYAAMATAAALPDFADLAEATGKAVVNISTVKTVKGSERLRDMFRQQHPRGGPFDEFFDQFDKFFNQQQPSKPQKQRSLGSGFIISDDGYIVTNNHVIADADEISINLQGHEDSLPATIVGRDPETDLALIKVENKSKLPFLEFGDSDTMRVGQWVLAIGNPFGLGHTVTAGIISAKGRVIGAGPFDDFLQTDASINPGNSGGPLLSMDGKVVGINSAIVASGQGIGFAVPSSLAKSVIAQLREHKSVQRGWLGVSIQDVDENAAKALGLTEPKGALISSVMPGEPGDKAGIKTGDVILKVGGADVADAGELLKAIAKLTPGQKVELTVWRKGKTVDVSATLGERNTEKLAKQQQEGEAAPDEAVASELGMSLRPLTEQEASALGLEKPEGLLVAGVEDGSKAETADVRPGDVILEANQQAVNSVEEFKKVLSGDAAQKGVIMLLVKRQGQNIFRTIDLSKKSE